MRIGGMRALAVFGFAGAGVLAMGGVAWAAPTVNAVNDSATTTAGTAVTVNVLANDTVSGGALDAATLHVVASPAHGAVSVSGGSATYSPAAGFTGTDTFGYEVCAASYGSSCDNATVTVTVGSSDTGSQGGYGGGDTVGTSGTGVSDTSTGTASAGTNSSQLPFTGAGTNLLAILGLACIGGGAMFYRSGRNRTRHLTR